MTARTVITLTRDVDAAEREESRGATAAPPAELGGVGALIVELVSEGTRIGEDVAAFIGRVKPLWYLLKTPK